MRTFPYTGIAVYQNDHRIAEFPQEHGDRRRHKKDEDHRVVDLFLYHIPEVLFFSFFQNQEYQRALQAGRPAGKTPRHFRPNAPASRPERGGTADMPGRTADFPHKIRNKSTIDKKTLPQISFVSINKLLLLTEIKNRKTIKNNYKDD